MVGLTLKVRYAPFFTKTHAKKIPETFDRNEILARALDLAAGIEVDRPIRLLGLRAEMAMPDDAREEREIRRRAAVGDGEASGTKGTCGDSGRRPIARFTAHSGGEQGKRRLESFVAN